MSFDSVSATVFLVLFGRQSLGAKYQKDQLPVFDVDCLGITIWPEFKTAVHVKDYKAIGARSSTEELNI